MSLIEERERWERLRVHVTFLAPHRRERAVDPILAGERKKSTVGLQQGLTGKNVPSAALHQRCPGLRKAFE